MNVLRRLVSPLNIRKSTKLLNLNKKWLQPSQCGCTTDAFKEEVLNDEEFEFDERISALPLITSREIDFPNPRVAPKQAWLENLDTLASKKLGIIDLHPDIFGAPPRLDILEQNVKWQQIYKHIDYRKGLTRGEMRGGRKKPWPQKRSGMHRQGSTRAPHHVRGGLSHGPRGPDSNFFMLPTTKREFGLRIALSVKYAQNDLHIVDNFDIPSDDPEYIRALMDTRYWGFTALFVDDTDMMPRNISLATMSIPHYNLMPVYGLNVFSMLKHETLVITYAALEKIEKKLLEQVHNQSPSEKLKYKS